MLQFIRMHFGPQRLAFLLHYFIAKAQSKAIGRLLPIIQESFDHPWVSTVKLKIRFSPGKEGLISRWWSYITSAPNNTTSMHWDAPITISIFRKRRGDEREALCMSLYIRAGILHIVQLQGVAGTDVPEELRPWPRMFNEACNEFARSEDLEEVRVAKASTLGSFRHPYGRSEMLTEAIKKAVPRIRRDMELLYDTNALALGLQPRGDWFTWRNARAATPRLNWFERTVPVAASLALIVVTTAILVYIHETQVEPHRLTYLYLLPLIFIAAVFTQQIAIICAASALLAADYFILDPVYSFYAYDYEELLWFGALAVVATTITSRLARAGRATIDRRRL